MRKAFVLLNHHLTDNQIKELNGKYLCDQIIYPGKELSDKWSGIAPVSELDMNTIKEVINWLDSSSMDDVLVIQGEFGSTFYIVDYALQKGIIPVHAVTKRVAQESREGEIVKRSYVFEHCCYRKYKYYSELEN